MIRTGEVIQYDPQLAFKESTFTYGAPAYLLTGLLWSYFGTYSVEVANILLFIGLGLILDNFFNDSWKKLFSIIIATGFLVTDTFIGLFSTVLFWMGLILYKKKNDYYLIPLILANITHPFTLFASFYFLFKNKKNLLWWTPIVLFYTYMIYTFPSSNLSLSFLLTILIPVFTIRVFIHFLPLFKKRLLRTLSLIIITLLITSLINGSGFTSYLNYNELTHNSDLTNFPNITNSYVKVLDYEIFPFIAQLHKTNITLYQGHFHENNLQKQNGYSKWDKSTEYFNQLEDRNISHVLFCKYCTIKTNEYYFFNTSQRVWSNKYYELYRAE